MDKPSIKLTRSRHVVTVSGKTLKSLRSNQHNLLGHLRWHGYRVEDVSYTTTARRMHEGLRCAYSVMSTHDLIDVLQRDVKENINPRKVSGRSSIVFMFTGQGATYPGMANDLFKTCEVFRKRILQLNSISMALGFSSFLEVITTSDRETRHLSPIQVHLALVCLEISLSAVWKSWGIMPDMVLGHSLGEYAALCTAGVLSVYDTIFLVGNRARLMEAHCTPYTHSMLSVEHDLESVKDHLQTGSFHACDIACVNGPLAIVVSGPLQDLIDLKRSLGGVRSTMLEVPFAFHSSQVDPILGSFGKLFSNVMFCEPEIPVVSTLTGDKVEVGGVFGPEYLIRQTRDPVKFLQAITTSKYGAHDSNSIWLEIGPAPVCLRLLHSIQRLPPERTLSTLQRKQSCWSSITCALVHLYEAGVNVRWSEYHKEDSVGLKLLDLPTYAFDLQNYWIPYEGYSTLMKSIYPTTKPPHPRISATCLHWIEEIVDNNECCTVTYGTDLRDASLFEIVNGHRVNGFGLCPSSLYIDMALTAALHLYQNIQGFSTSSDMSLMDLEISHPLVVTEEDDVYRIKVHCKYIKIESAFEIRFNSDNNHGLREHASCQVRFGQGSKWKNEWHRTRHLIASKIEHLNKSSTTGSGHRILREMVYKLFSKLVTYGERYQNLREVFMDNKRYEAAARVQFSPSAKFEDFNINPYWVDGMIYLAGFAINAHPRTRDDLVYISTGWDELCVSAPLFSDIPYASYVHMQQSSRGLLTGDVYLLDGGEIVAMCAGLRFQEVKASSLHVLLRSAAKASDSSNALGEGDPHEQRCMDQEIRQQFSNGSQTLLSSTNGICTDIQSIIALETGMNPSEFPEDVRFEELGIDSILRIPIISKIQTEMNLPLSPSVFDDYPTLAALRNHIQNAVEPATSRSSSNEHPSSMTLTSGTSTPATPHGDVFGTLLEIITRESGINVRELNASANFSFAGVNPSNTTRILGVLKTYTGIELPSSFFTEHPTLSSAQQSLQTCKKLPTTESQAALKSTETYFCSHSILLSGSHLPGSPILFLIPDGAGSPSSYTDLPALPRGTPIYGLESPFCHEPLQWDCSFEMVATMYVKAIRQIQPQGPYMLGGWSLGGVHAYEVARQFLLDGEKVRGLLLIDAPSPNFLGYVSDPARELLQETGLFAAAEQVVIVKKALTRVNNHMRKCVESLKHYNPEPMYAHSRPHRVFAIWATRGISEQLEDKEKISPSDEDVTHHEVRRLQRWMKEQRTSFGPNGWDRLVGEVECRVTEGDHRSILHEPWVSFPRLF